MTKLFISIILVSTVSLFGIGFVNLEGVTVLSNTYLMTGFYLMVFSGLAGVGLVDLVNQNEIVSHK
ncbi:MAG: hypothetical protein O7C75_00245 [Verrucomicrobia bacterium]|nr:hypothetical protein [Verrucomicrobiota bacterium]